jgi:dienelactone hydrolase
MRTVLLSLLLFGASLSVAQQAGSDYPALREVHPFPYSRFFVPNPVSPQQQEPRTSILMLHGSEGGSVPYIESEATILATQGFAVLTFCYFDCGRGFTGPRETLKDVDTARVTSAIAWLRSQPMSNGKVVLYGFSRGAELALVIASLASPVSEEQPTAVIAHSPSDVFNSYWNWSWRDPACWLCRRGIGQCRDNPPRTDLQWNPACGRDDETRMDFSQSAWLIDSQPVRTGTRIPIERFEGPILITVGEQDATWPVEQTRRIEQTLRTAGRQPQIHYFPEAGHVFGYQDENLRRQLVFDFLRALPASSVK